MAILNSIEDMYRLFLDNIKRESTAVVPPTLFNRLINEAQLSVVLATARNVELGEEQIGNLKEVHPKPVVLTGVNEFQIPNGHLRTLGVMTKLQYGPDQECGLTGISDWLPVQFLSADKKTIVYKNPYRKPTDVRLYYLQYDQVFQVLTGGSTAIELLLDYLILPADMNFVDVNNPLNVDCVLSVPMKKKIVEEAARIHLERLMNPRYQSFYQEQVLRQQEK